LEKVDRVEMVPELKTELARNKRAREQFERIPVLQKKQFLWCIVSARRGDKDEADRESNRACHGQKVDERLLLREKDGDGMRPWIFDAADLRRSISHVCDDRDCPVDDLRQNDHALPAQPR
jgi:hypothetical protein